ncbi:hypothetical protein BGW36DRAFT_428316 [Talaromyces proteolyticus]|uniref:Uncharacterized protein n=1 Tax=Talaromyces proteolyticus TaxID=1131652 RepID=A0AAD4KSY8_9EURO|nr:uncharacterized protein BGW36DRAFT_428316 [Talaromyces proteolyticus]KAH8696300.1 hypothetical protein BGW36DRAFT_428316 [Talaromyces proteolyticus]
MTTSLAHGFLALTAGSSAMGWNLLERIAKASSFYVRSLLTPSDRRQIAVTRTPTPDDAQTVVKRHRLNTRCPVEQMQSNISAATLVSRIGAKINGIVASFLAR